MKASHSQKTIFIVLAIVLGAVVCISIPVFFLKSMFGNSKILGSALSSIAVLKVEGEISSYSSAFQSNTYNHTWTLNQIDNLINDPSNKGIILVVNSPGGGVYESDQLFLKLKQYKEITKRPVYAYMAQLAASGGYYISMAADKVYANRMTQTGSIGVIISIMDTTGLENKLGIKTNKIVSGKNKALGSPLTSEQRDILQSIVDETYNTFVSIVSENRKLDIEKVKSLADGRIYTAAQAKELKLIDEISDFDSVVKDMKKKYNLEKSGVDILTNETSIFGSLMSAFSKNKSVASELNMIREAMRSKNNGMLMYYYEP